MEIKEITKLLWDRGIRGVRISWAAGGDDGGIRGLELIPPKPITKAMKEDLEELAWKVYENDFEGGISGEFTAYGHLDIILSENEYQTSADNNYAEDIFDEETESYSSSENEFKTLENVLL